MQKGYWQEEGRACLNSWVQTSGHNCQQNLVLMICSDASNGCMALTVATSFPKRYKYYERSLRGLLFYHCSTIILILDTCVIHTKIQKLGFLCMKSNLSLLTWRLLSLDLLSTNCESSKLFSLQYLIVTVLSKWITAIELIQYMNL